MNHVVEVVLFRLKPNSDVDAFLKAADATFDLLSSTEGYLHRELSVSDDGQWVDMVHWANMDVALHAAEHVMQDPVGQAFGAFIDETSLMMTHTHPKQVK